MNRKAISYREEQRQMEARFLRDVRNHRMTIITDNGLHRHVTFRAPGTGAYHFHITTWPGYLAITGDMDAFTFSRLSDMFDFHRTPQDRTIDYGYWAQKAVAVAKNSGTETFSEDRYRAAIRSDLLRHIEGRTFAERREIVAAAKADDLFDAPNSREDAYQRAMGWKCPVDGRWPFQDFWDHSLMEPSFGFRWACHAIRWGIRQYDLAKAGNTQADHDRRVLAGTV